MVASLKKAIGLLALIAAAYLGFRWGPVIFPPLERALGLVADGGGPVEAAEVPSPEMADETLELFESFRRGEEDQLALGGTQLTSVIRYAVPGLLPPGVNEPTVRLEAGRVHLSAGVVMEAFPDLPSRLDQVVGLLPDTLSVELEGALVPFDQRHLALLVERIEASRIPLPRRLLGEVLAGLGRNGRPGLPADALPVPLPDGVQSVYVQGDSLFLVAKR